VPTAGDAKQARQLRHGDSQAGADLEADQYAVADQLDQGTQSKPPRHQAERGQRETGKTCNLRITLRIAVGHYAHSSGDH
jgi:hypothetical protein